MMQPMFVIVDPVQPSNNTARNSFRTPDVLKSFRNAFKRLKSLIYTRFQETLVETVRPSKEAAGAQPIANSLSESGLVEVNAQDSLRFGVQLREAEQQRLSSDARECATDFSNVFSSVDFVQTFLAPEQALKS
jgi:hypothetical protein